MSQIELNADIFGVHPQEFTPEDIDLIDRAEAALREANRMVHIEVEPRLAAQIVAYLQLALRHPASPHRRSTEHVLQFTRELSALLPGPVQEIAANGWPEESA